MNLPLFLGLRLVQGFVQGLTIPLLMTTALRVLDAPIRLYGLAAYALSATVFPTLGATISAFWTDFVGVQFAFYQDIPLCAIAPCSSGLACHKTSRSTNGLPSSSGACIFYSKPNRVPKGTIKYCPTVPSIGIGIPLRHAG
jgi:MFS family permease